MREKNCYVGIDTTKNGCTVMFWKYLEEPIMVSSVFDKSICRAVCLAALAAMEGRTCRVAQTEFRRIARNR